MHPVRLIHFADKPVVLGTMIARGQDEAGCMKPTGLWVSDEDEFGWRAWCIDNDFRLDQLTHVHEVTLSNTAEICYLRTPREIVEFGRAFLITHGPLGEMTARGMFYALDWVRVIQRWGGIIITPYQWACRLEHDCFWYYGWDCASGCIWEPTAIGSVILREITEVPTATNYDVEPD